MATSPTPHQFFERRGKLQAVFFWESDRERKMEKKGVDLDEKISGQIEEVGRCKDIM